MTKEEYHLIDNYNKYSFYTGKMGKVFTDWYDGKIDGTNAIKKLKQWYNKGLKKIEEERNADIKKAENKKEEINADIDADIKIANSKADIRKLELKRHFDSLFSYIDDNDLVDNDDLLDNYENHFFMILLKNIAPFAYQAMKKALSINFVVYENGLFNFKCAIGWVGKFFREAGYTEHKTISQYILINGKTPKGSSLKNAANSNTLPNEWEAKRKQIFSEQILNKPKINPK